MRQFVTSSIAVFEAAIRIRQVYMIKALGKTWKRRNEF